MSLPKIKEGQKIKGYIIHKELGAGCFGRVYEAINTNEDNNLVAIKCVSKGLQKSSPKAYQLFQAERTILSKIKNENVVGFVDYFESSQVCFLVLEYCNEGDLEGYLKSKPGKKVPEKEAIQYFQQILNGFRSMHEANILHRDMKLPNILKHNGQLKIADLGFAKELKHDRQLTATILGTPYTMAPEVLEEKPYGLACDIYSIGVNFYQVVFGEYPFNGRSEHELLNNIKKQNIKFNHPGVQVSQNMIDLLSRMLKYDVRERISMDQIWSHPLLQVNIKEENLGLQHLHSSVINIQRNKDFYKNNNPFDNQNNQQKPQIDNPFAPPQPHTQQPQYEEQNVNQNEVQIHMTQYNEKKKIEDTIKVFIGNYHQEINTLNQITKCISSAYNLPNTGINTFYPNFFMLKKLIFQQKRVLNDMEKRNNIFQCPYPQQLFQSAFFLNTLRELKERVEINQMYFIARQCDMQDLMDQTPNPDIIDELSEEYTQKTEQIYQQTMINYYFNLNEEVKKNLSQSKIQEAIGFQKHMVEVLDCLDLDTFFRKQVNFNFEAYQQHKESLDYQRREELINDKAKFIFK